jgi:cytochrome c peroxidase
MAYCGNVPGPRRARIFIFLLLFALCTCALSGCNNPHRADGAEGTDVEIQFDVRVGEQPVRCGRALPGLGVNGRATTLKDLRFYVHDVRLIDRAGKQVALELLDDGEFQAQNVGKLDFEDQSGACANGTLSTNAVLRGKAPSGDYRGLSFRVGVPHELNHENPLKIEKPLGMAGGLWWGWQLGHIFFKLELAMAESPDDRANTFPVHLGAEECVGNLKAYTCDRENVPLVVLDDFAPRRDKVVLDLAALLAESTLANRPLAPSKAEEDDKPVTAGCAGAKNDPDCEPLFTALGLELASGDVSRMAQSAFVVRAREADDPGTVYPEDAGAPEQDEIDAGPSDYVLDVPEELGFPQPRIPADNPLTVAKVELGRHLFYDKRLSGNQTQSCASCHQQERAFTDGLALGLGSTGVENTRGSMSLANVVYAPTLTWARPDIVDLETQALVPMFGKEPVELGLADNGEDLIARLREVSQYKELFPAAFPGTSDPFTVANVVKAITSFERTLISANSPYDQFLRGDLDAISDSAKHGAELFFDPGNGFDAFECFHCHGGATFTDQFNDSRMAVIGGQLFHNNGLYNLDAYGSYPEGNQGVYERSKENPDRGRFKAPTLRNIAMTAPYMHDGSIATLEDVVAHYARGGRKIESGPLAGDGKASHAKDVLVHGFSATEQERADLIAFLESLTDEEFLHNKAFSDPWQQGAAAR